MSHHTPIPTKTTLELAKERLYAFMVKHDASIDECAKIMGLASSKDLDDMMKAGERHSHDAMVMQFFAFGAGADAKLEAMRNPVSDISDDVISESGAGLDTSPLDDEPKQEPEATMQQLARRMYMSFRRKHGFAAQQVAAMMNQYKPESVSRTFKAQSIAVAISPSMLHKFSDIYAKDILLALAQCPWQIMPLELETYQNKQKPSQAKRIEPENKPAQQDKVVDIKHRPFVKDECAKDECAKDECTNGEQDKPNTQTVRIKPEDACLDSTIDFMLSNEGFKEAFYKKVAAKAEQRVIDILGASPEDLKGVAPMVDMLIAAKRGGLRVRMVVES